MGLPFVEDPRFHVHAYRGGRWIQSWPLPHAGLAASVEEVDGQILLPEVRALFDKLEVVSVRRRDFGRVLHCAEA